MLVLEQLVNRNLNPSKYTGKYPKYYVRQWAKMCSFKIVSFSACWIQDMYTFCFTTYSFLMTLVSWFAKSLHTQQGHDQSLYSAPFTTALQNLWNFCLSFIFSCMLSRTTLFISTVFNQRNMKNCTLGESFYVLNWLTQIIT